jgi:drug/metabolite transporter (DMT)-like permease
MRKTKRLRDMYMSDKQHKGHGAGVAMLLSASLIWGVAFVAQSAGMEFVGPYTFTAVRSALAALGLGVLILIRSRKETAPKDADHKIHWRAGVLLGVVLTIASNLQQIGLVTTSAGKAGFITSLYIVFVPIFGLLIGRKPHPMLWLSVAIALAGLYFLSIRGDFSISRGDFLVLLSAFAFTVQILIVDRYVNHVDVLRLSFIQFAVMALLSSVPMLLLEQPKLQSISQAWITIVYAGLFSGCGAYTLQMLGQRRMEPAAASLLLSPENVFSALAGWVILGQTLSLRELAGCALVFVGVVASQLPWGRLYRKSAAEEPVAPEPVTPEAIVQTGNIVE